jgi:hypothetical protein
MHTTSSFTIILLAPLTLPRRLTPRSTSVRLFTLLGLRDRVENDMRRDILKHVVEYGNTSADDMSAPGDQSDGASQVLLVVPVGSGIVLSSSTAGEGCKV